MALLEVKDLNVYFETLRGTSHVLDHMSFSLEQGEALGLVGDSGCGKSVTSLAIMGLLPKNSRREAKSLKLNGKDLLSLKEKDMQLMRGSEVAMIFQDPMSSLNPSFNVGFQIGETLKVHGKAQSKKLIRELSIDLLGKVGIPSPEERLNAYPHQLSGGMCQRIMIAMAIACEPKLLIADEPTTALDVTIQAQILDLIKTLQKKNKMSLILITHDLAVVSENTDRIAIIYAGQIAETGKTQDILKRPVHPFTSGLLNSLPGNYVKEETHRQRLPSIPGLVPDLVNRPTGCQFHPRCQYKEERCVKSEPATQVVEGRGFKCHFPIHSGQP